MVAKKSSADPSDKGRPVVEDDRFKHVHHDPRFAAPPSAKGRFRKPKGDSGKDGEKKQRAAAEETKPSVLADERFKGLLTDKRFREGGGERFIKEFYGIDDPPEDSSGSEEEDTDAEGTSDEENVSNAAQSESEDESESDEESSSESDEANGEKAVPVPVKRRDVETSVMAGSSESEEEEDGAPDDDSDVSSSDSSDDDSSADEDSDAEDEASSEEEEIRLGDATTRMAVVGVDWDHVSAKDLLVLLQSFCSAAAGLEGGSSDGLVKTVTIYVSDFGAERLAIEKEKGPQLDLSLKNEKLRIKKYEMERLKYYYAVAEFDAWQTAKAVYDECDGAELERSANVLDLRFVPDEMDFTGREVKDRATEIPEAYEALDFTTKALQHSNPNLTWEDDSSRRKKLEEAHRKFTQNEMSALELQQYIANESDSDAADSDGYGYAAADDLEEDRATWMKTKGQKDRDESDGSDDDSSESDEEKDMSAKYRALLLDDDGDVAQDDESSVDGGEMEMTFRDGDTVGESAGKEILRKVEERKLAEKETVWERHQRLKKEKKRAAKQTTQADSDSDSDAMQGDDDDVPSDASLDGDDFFAPSEKRSSAGVSKKNSKRNQLSDAELAARQKAELELLLMNEEDVDVEPPTADANGSTKPKSKKSKRTLTKKKQRALEATEGLDSFKVDVGDQRFSALYDSHHFAIDPTDPQYKKTDGMADLLDEKKKRRSKDIEDTAAEARKPVVASSRHEKSSEVDRLVSSLKNKKKRAGGHFDAGKKKSKKVRS